MQPRHAPTPVTGFDMSDATGRTRWLGHRPGRSKLQAQYARHGLSIAELHVKDDGLARRVLDLHAPRRCVHPTLVDDSARENRPGPDSGGRGGVRVAVVAELHIEELQIGVTITTVQNPTLRVVAWCP